MKRIVLLLGCLAMMSSAGTQAGDLYRWTDAKGKVHYGDVIPVGATQIEIRKFPDAAAPAGDLPYETHRAQQNFPVILYVADNCVEYCNQARNLLNKRGIPFSEKMLQTQEDIDAFGALSGFGSVPTLGVGKSFLKGFLAEQWHSELDIAGYPKIAPYRPTSIPHAPPATSEAESPAIPESASEAASANETASDSAAEQ